MTYRDLFVFIIENFELISNKSAPSLCSDIKMILDNKKPISAFDDNHFMSVDEYAEIHGCGFSVAFCLAKQKGALVTIGGRYKIVKEIMLDTKGL